MSELPAVKIPNDVRFYDYKSTHTENYWDGESKKVAYKNVEHEANTIVEQYYDYIIDDPATNKGHSEYRYAHFGLIVENINTANERVTKITDLDRNKEIDFPYLEGGKISRRQLMGRLVRFYISMRNSCDIYGIYQPWRQTPVGSYVRLQFMVYADIPGNSELYYASSFYGTDERYEHSQYDAERGYWSCPPIVCIFDITKTDQLSDENMIFSNAVFNEATGKYRVNTGGASFYIQERHSGSSYYQNMIVPPGRYKVWWCLTGAGLYPYGTTSFEFEVNDSKLSDNFYSGYSYRNIPTKDVNIPVIYQYLYYCPEFTYAYGNMSDYIEKDAIRISLDPTSSVNGFIPSVYMYDFTDSLPVCITYLSFKYYITTFGSSPFYYRDGNHYMSGGTGCGILKDNKSSLGEYDICSWLRDDCTEHFDILKFPNCFDVRHPDPNGSVLGYSGNGPLVSLSETAVNFENEKPKFASTDYYLKSSGYSNVSWFAPKGDNQYPALHREYYVHPGGNEIDNIKSEYRETPLLAAAKINALLYEKKNMFFDEPARFIQEAADDSKIYFDQSSIPDGSYLYIQSGSNTWYSFDNIDVIRGTADSSAIKTSRVTYEATLPGENKEDSSTDDYSVHYSGDIKRTTYLNSEQRYEDTRQWGAYTNHIYPACWSGNKLMRPTAIQGGPLNFIPKI